MNFHVKTMDGNEAAAYSSYAFTEIAGIYPITPSSPMAEYIDEWAAKGKKNIFGNPVRVIEMQSEAGAISVVHGALDGGLISSSYTASQGLLLMIPTMFRIAGQLKPCVIHVASRNVATNAISINAEHSDVMACRQTGFAMLASSSVQETMDFSAVAHLSAIRGHVPFLHFFDGFRTSHELQKVRLIDYADLATLVDWDALREFRTRALNPNHPLLRTSGQYAETYFQSREACNHYYNQLPEIVKGYLDDINRLTGTNYRPYMYYGAENAEAIIVGMGSVAGTARETVDYFCKRGLKVGYVDVHLYRPMSPKYLLAELPNTLKCITVLDRTKEPGAVGEPLYEDLAALIHEHRPEIKVLACRYGLAGKDTRPSHIASVFNNMLSGDKKNHCTVGINDDVTFRSLQVGEELITEPEGTVSCKFWGLGSDGTVSANTNTIKIIGDHTNLHVQAFFEYDGRKSGGVTRSHLRFGPKEINSSYLVRNADFVACSNKSYLTQYDILSDIRPGGKVLLNCDWEGEDFDKNVSIEFKKAAVEKNIQLFIIDAAGIAKELGLGNRTNTILQAAFFKIINLIPPCDAEKHLKNAVLESYGLKGDEVIQKNYAAIENGMQKIKKMPIPNSWYTITELSEGFNIVQKDNTSDFINKIMIPTNKMVGDSIPVSTFLDWVDGSMPQGTSRYEKRAIAERIPIWDPEKCIQCNICSFVCPHAAIRPFLLTEEEAETAPKGMSTVAYRGKATKLGFRYKIQVSAFDCVGCGSCVESCLAKEKAIKMLPLLSHCNEASYWDYLHLLPDKDNPEAPFTVKGSQFQRPLLEFPGSCPGCGETPYAKLVTQLFGERMLCATATGCAQVWASSFPSFPYTTNSVGKGPAVGSSLFENNAEYGLGICLSATESRRHLLEQVKELLSLTDNENVISAATAWIDGYSDGEKTVMLSRNLCISLQENTLSGKANDVATSIILARDHLEKKSIWLFGGDGWAYDIGYGGLDHVLATGEDLNVLVFDTEVYSNTGGQASKATPTGAVAQFAYAGKRRKKKDLGLMAMCYGDVYVAQVSLGANPAQLIRALKEAESYPGPSLIIAYSPCINHGLKCGMAKVNSEAKKAVDVGYWQLFRYNPLLLSEGKPAFVLDSKEPAGDFQDFLMGEVRYSALKKSFPDEADSLFEKTKQDAMARYSLYKELSKKTFKEV